MYDVQEYRSIREKLKKQFKELRVKVQANLINQEFSDKVKSELPQLIKQLKIIGHTIQLRKTSRTKFKIIFRKIR